MFCIVSEIRGNVSATAEMGIKGILHSPQEIKKTDFLDTRLRKLAYEPTDLFQVYPKRVEVPKPKTKRLYHEGRQADDEKALPDAPEADWVILLNCGLIRRLTTA